MRYSTRCAVLMHRALIATLACLLWGTSPAHANPARAETAAVMSVTSASWGVVITTAANAPYAPGPAVNVANFFGSQYFTVASLGSRRPASVVYRLSNFSGLSVTAASCATRWTGTGTCSTGSTPMVLNTPQSSIAAIPPLSGALYLQVSVVLGNGQLTVEASSPTPSTRNE